MARLAVLARRGRSTREDDGRAGFLLTETLATFTISAFVLLGLVSAASVLLRAVDGSVTRIERVDDLGRAMEAIRQDVAAISRARWNGTEPQPFVFRGSPNSLYFAQAAPAAGGGRASTAVALREIVVDGRPTLVRTTARLGTRATSFSDLEFGPQREIWTGAARLRFGYVPQRDGDGEPIARTSWPVGAKLPAAILIEAIDRETRRVLVATRVTIAANADVGCIKDDEPTAAPAQPDAAQNANVPPTNSPPQPAPGPAPAPGAPTQAAADEAFCSLAQDADTKGAKDDQGAKPAVAAPPGPDL